MIRMRRSDERGRARFGWLDSRHTFSFGHYYDPDYMGFGTLRVINEDRVSPGTGFDTHGHRDMEIVTYVLEGGLEHRDSLGNGSVIRPGDVQRMTAGTGIRHSEFNASSEVPVHLLQIWILPERSGLTPGYEEKHFGTAAIEGGLRLVASGDARDGSLTIHQDADIYATRLAPGQRVDHALADGRMAWLQLARGSVELNGRLLAEGDGAAIEAEPILSIRTAADEAEFLLFDMGA